MLPRIDAIRLEGFRGATRPVELEFDTQKPVAIIFGENGTGKSTIVDAIDFVCNGQPGSLTYLSSTNIKSHLPSLGTKAKDLKVSLSFNGQTWAATLDKKGPEITGPDGQPTARILRRSMILSVVTAEPKERYEALKGFIAVPNVQKCEATLREAVRGAEHEEGEAKRATQQAKESLQTLWKAEGKPGTGWLPWAKGEAAKDPSALDEEVKAGEKALEKLTTCVEASKRVAQARENHKLAEDALTEARNAFANAKAEVEGLTESLIDVLQYAQSFLQEKSDAQACPVCEQEIDPTALSAQIKQRLTKMKKAVELKKRIEAEDRKVTRTAAVVQKEQQTFAAAVMKMVPCVKDSSPPEITGLGIDWSKYPRLQDPQAQTSEAAVAKESQDLLAVVETGEAALRKKHEERRRTLAQLNAIKGHVDAVKEKSAAAKRLGVVAGRLKAFLEVAEEARKTYVEGVLSTISGVVEKLYLKVHPDEGIGGIRLYLDPRYQGSLQFDSNFQSETGVPPQAYYSESHLDTLGVCIFLALARHFHDSNTVVVLDDVLTSVDSAHVTRFMDMLHAESSRYNQLIITTHYRPWRERYRFARGPTGNVQLIELLHWSLPRGIRHTKTKLSIEELQETSIAEPLDRQSVSSKAGILMESLLDHVALLYGCRLPRKAEPEYTLGELTDCISGKLRKALRVQRVSAKTTPDGESKVESETAINELLIRIAGVNWIRNRVGCHYSSWGPDVSEGEVKEFANLTIEFAEALVCEQCGEVPRVEKGGAYHQCGCGRTRLHPCNNPD